MAVFYLSVQQSLMIATAIIMVSLGGMFSERSGVINIALEGIMVFGGFAGSIFISVLQQNGSTLNPQLILILAMLIATLAGGLMSLLLGVSAINLKADQTIGGTAINLMSPALVIFLARTILGAKNIPISSSSFFIRDESWALARIPVLGDLFFKNTYITVYFAVAILVIVSVVLFRTRFGLRLRACGEHPHAADSVGINVYKMRYSGVVLSGMLGGLGGLMLIVTTTGNFSGTVSGYGFLALGVMIFGQWKPYRIALAALFFAFLNTVSSIYTSIPFLFNIGLPSDIYRMLPYIATLVVLAFTSKKSRAPKAEGIPYDKGLR